MSSVSDSPVSKKNKKFTGDGDNSEREGELDSETQLVLEEIDSLQTEIDSLNEKASEEILAVEQKYNNIRKPFFTKRNDMIRKIPNFWVTAFVNHPQISALLSEEEEECLHYMVDLEVEECEDIKSGYRIKLSFSKNPYFSNDSICKQFHLGTSAARSECSRIHWTSAEQNLVEIARGRASQPKASRKRPLDACKSFFSWFVDTDDPSQDDIADVIKDDIWPNPLQYFLVPDMENDQILDEHEELDDSAYTDEHREADVSVESTTTITTTTTTATAEQQADNNTQTEVDRSNGTRGE